MLPGWLGWLVITTGALAAWAAARSAAALPLIFAAVLLGCFALPTRERRLFPLLWGVLPISLLACSWPASLDHELALRHTLLFVLAAFLFGLSRRVKPTDRQLAVLATVVALTACVAIGQAAGGLAAARAAVGQLAPELRETALARLAGGRAFGTAALPGHFAALLVMVAPILVARSWRTTGWRRFAWLSGVALVAAGVVLSRSLAAAGVAGIVLVLALLRGRVRYTWVAAGGLVVVAVVLMAAAFRGDLATLEPVRLRLVNWRTAGWVFVHHCWLGTGLGGIGQAGLLAPGSAANITPYAHNSYLQMLAELGVAGVGLLAAGVVALVRLIRDGLREAPALALAVAVMPLHNLVDFSAYAPEVLLPWAVLAGALAARARPLPARALPAWFLLPVLGAGTVVSTLAWRGEVGVAEAVARSAQPPVHEILAAARWTPWAVSPVMTAAAAALASPARRSGLITVEEELSRRHWVRPRSSAWAELRGRLLLAAGRRGEALAWVREARRRAPWRNELEELEVRCRRAP